jgi:hypothetical protein
MISRAKLKDKVLVIELPLQEPKISASGKGIVVASTRGPLDTGIDFKGSDIFVVANTYVKNPKYSRQNENVQKNSKRVPQHET